MSFKSINFKVNDRRPSLRVNLRGVDGTSIDLTGASNVRLAMAPEGTQNLKVDGVCVIENAPTGQVRYDWLAADVDTVGTFQAEFQVNFTDGTQQTVPSSGYLYITFQSRLGE